MAKYKRILIDMDGVVADFRAGWTGLFGCKDPWKEDPEYRGSRTWGDIHKHVGIGAGEFWGSLGHDFWSNLPLLPWAQSLVELCRRHVGSDNIAFCTSPCHTEGCIEGKVDWAEWHFCDVPVIITKGVLQKGLPPKKFLASSGVLLIDDFQENTSSFILAGGDAFLFPQPWNDMYHKSSCGLVLLADHLRGRGNEEWRE